MTTPSRRTFASDNSSGAHPDVIAAIAEANHGHAPAYGADSWTARAEALLEEHFGPGTRGYLLFNGTGANVTALASALRPHQAVVCSTDAHLHTDECGAPVRFTGSTVLPVTAHHGLLTRETVDRELPPGDRGEHQVVPAVLSLTNSSELGTIYRPDHVADLCRWAHSRGMAVHMDGARLANAAASAGCSLAEVSTAAGVDIVTLGGTKNGLVFGDAVVFAPTSAGRAASEVFRYARKQAMQLASKMRFIAAQFIALLEGDLWLRNATAANAAARELAGELADVPGIEIAYPVEANAVFARMTPRIARPLSQEFGFYAWDPRADLMRLVCSYDTDRADIDALVAAARRLSA
ncbi:L-threonine aldolase [Pseudonocardia thermophila]|jgi:Threonine aldolase|uniref:L-threonine aldolase n=1 Tax=Pseudonocardia thermophila TaxID=1848 RepID=A0A1M6XI05_PSETH|nr:beta-eliminating lyase-related protein [Pseudonocardia thermophila]SHL05571.1 L-threonine aldolase [Pseudonocardia thermophila]